VITKKETEEKAKPSREQRNNRTGITIKEQGRKTNAERALPQQGITISLIHL